MNKRELANLYPYYAELLPYLRYFNLLQDRFQLSAVGTFPGSSLSGHDVSYAYNQSEVGIPVQVEIDVNDEWTTLIMVEPEGLNSAGKNHCIKLAHNTVKAGKKVLYFPGGKQLMVKYMRGLDKNYPNQVIFCQPDTRLDSMALGQQKVWEINTPIVLLGGLVDCSEYRDALLLLYLGYKELGIKVGVISNDPLAALFGSDSFRHIYESKDLSEAQKISQINHAVHQMETETQPDLILIQAPDPLMKFSNVAHNGYGIRITMLCQALRVICLLAAIPRAMAVSPVLRSFNKEFNRRLHCSLNGVIISNAILDLAATAQSHQVELSYSPSPSLLDSHLLTDSEFTVLEISSTTRARLISVVSQVLSQAKPQLAERLKNAI